MKKNLLKSALFMLAMMAVPAHAMAQDAQPAAAAQDVPKPTAVLDYSQLPEPMAFAKAQYKEALRLNGLKAGEAFWYLSRAPFGTNHTIKFLNPTK